MPAPESGECRSMRDASSRPTRADRPQALGVWPDGSDAPDGRGITPALVAAVDQSKFPDRYPRLTAQVGFLIHPTANLATLMSVEAAG
jgi:hypothetical protein